MLTDSNKNTKGPIEPVDTPSFSDLISHYIPGEVVPLGPIGNIGPRGFSNYELAKKNGFLGDELEYLDSLKGLDIYQLWLNEGNTGSLEEFLLTLKGSNGDNGINGKSNYELAIENGFSGSLDEYLNSLKGSNGEDGLSAYQLWLLAGNTGSVIDFFLSLKGDPGLSGIDGKNAYELAIENGFEGTIDEFLNSLKGPAGDPELIEEINIQIELLKNSKLDAIDYVQHFRGVFSSYSSLISALPTALDGDYAHIDSGSGFDRLAAIWDSDDNKWIINNVNVGSNTDEVPEGSNNKYFTQERVRQSILGELNINDSNSIKSTDKLIEAICKLQAQVDDNKWNWVEFDTVGNWGQWIQPFYELGGAGGIQVCKKDGALWMRGMIRVVETSSNQNNQLLTFTNQEYFIDIYRNLVSYQTPNWITRSATYGNFANFRIRRNQNFFMYLSAVSQLNVDSIYILPPSCIGLLG